MIEEFEQYIWTPVRTKPRQEKKLAEYCESNQVRYYLPLNKKVHRYGRRTVEFYSPMFSGYVFCNVDEESYKKLLLSNSIVYRISIDKKQEANLIAELNAVKAFEELARENEVVVKPELVEGARIKITEGPLKGIDGIIEKRKEKTLVTINIELLGQAVTTEVDVGDIDLDE